MNGFASHGFAEDNFGEAKGVLKSFDAFREFCLTP